MREGEKKGRGGRRESSDVEMIYFSVMWNYASTACVGSVTRLNLTKCESWI